MSLEVKQLYEFDRYRLDTARRALLSDGNPVPLTPKAFDTLLALVRHGGDVVGKDELLKEVWPDTFVEEATLTQNVSTLRKALGRDRSGKHFIETVPKYGYRFAAPVSAHSISDNHVLPRPAATSHAVLPARAGFKRMPRALLLILPLLILVPAALITVKFFARSKLRSDEPPFQKMRLARLTNHGNVTRAALSPDGSYAAYALDDDAQQSLWLRQVSETNSVQVVPSRNVEYLRITFAVDNSYIFFSMREKDNPVGVLYQVPLLGGAPRKILEDIDSGISLSPDGQRFAFIRQTPGKGEGALMIADINGTNARAVAVRKRPDVLSNKAVAWSPDGKAIVCTVRVGDNTDPYMMLIAVSLQEGTEKILTQERWAWIGEAAWLRDGSGLIFNAALTRASDFSPQLWRLSSGDGKVSKVTNDLNSYDGVSLTQNNATLSTVQTNRLANFWTVPIAAPGHATRLTNGASDQFGEQMGCAASPDDQLVFGSTASGNLDIWMMDADGKNQRQLTFDPQPDLKPVVSPDGRFVVFVSWRTKAPHLWRMNIDGSNLQQLTNGDADTFPDISPDGQWVVYDSVSRGNATLWKVLLAGGEAVKLSDDFAMQPSISPDGKLIAYFQVQSNSLLPKLVLMPFAGGAPLKSFDLPPDTFPLAGLRWTRDGRALSYVVTKGKVSNVWSQPLDKGQARQVTDFLSDQIFRFAWSHDGSRLILERGVDINDVVLISNSL